MKQENNPPIGEARFIIELEKRAKLQHKLVETQLIPDWAKGIGSWLAVNPWRVLVPCSAMLYTILRFAFGTPCREFILGLFGGFVR